MTASAAPPADSSPETAPATPQSDIAALAKGGRTNLFGFALRLLARVPFLFIAGRLYGADNLGRFASAMVVIELAGQFCTLGQKRGLAQRLSVEERHPANIVADAMLLSTGIAAVAMALLFLVPAPMFPSGIFSYYDLFLPLALIPTTLTDIALSALAYKFDVKTTVRSRAVVEPWTLSIMAGVMYFVVPEGGLAIAYIASMYTSALVALVPLARSYGRPRGWRPHPLRLAKLAWANLPLAAADAVEWGTRKLDIFILGMFATPTGVGVYYVAQQVASLPQKLKTSFEPVLGPVITRNLKEHNYKAIAHQVCQVGFWIVSAQAGIALALGIPGKAVMGMVGPHFTGGTGALAFLLAAEVVAATAVVSEAALIYVARFANLVISLGTIALQAALTVGFVLAVRAAPGWHLPWGLHIPAERVPFCQAGAVAAALMIALGTASVLKSQLLSRVLKERVNNWRWPLVWAAAPAIVMGWAVTRFLPVWLELSVGIPAILAIYCWIIWNKGFGPDDRVLFRRNIGG